MLFVPLVAFCIGERKKSILKAETSSAENEFFADRPSGCLDSDANCQLQLTCVLSKQYAEFRLQLYYYWEYQTQTGLMLGKGSSLLHVFLGNPEQVDIYYDEEGDSSPLPIS
jgi:hypothetical protein